MAAIITGMALIGVIIFLIRVPQLPANTGVTAARDVNSERTSYATPVPHKQEEIQIIQAPVALLRDTISDVPVQNTTAIPAREFLAPLDNAPLTEETPKVTEKAAITVDTVLPTSAWIASSSPTSAVHNYASVETPCFVGTFAFPSTVKGCPQIVCDYRIPHDGRGAPLPTSADIVAIFPYPTEKNATEGMASSLASRWGFTIYSLRFPGMDKESGNDPTTYYYFPQSGSGEAYRTALRKVQEIAGFPERKIFVTGRSGGGSSAVLFANAYPNDVETVAQEAGRVFPADIKFLGPMLMTHGECDYVRPNVLAFEAALSAVHADVTRISFRPNWGSRGKNTLWTHGQWEGRGAVILYQWIVDVANLRVMNQGHVPAFSTWHRDRGCRFPGPLSMETWVSMPSPRNVIAGRIGEASLSQPSPKVNSQAVVILIHNAFVESEDEARFDGDQLADRQFTTIVSSNESVAQTAWESLGKNERKLPILIVYYGSDRKILDVSSSIRDRCLGIVLFARPDLPVDLNKKVKALPPFMVAWPQERTLPEVPSGYEIKQYKLGTVTGLNHSKRVEVIADHLKKILEAHGPIPNVSNSK